jgi:hypothetical protein
LVCDASGAVVVCADGFVEAVLHGPGLGVIVGAVPPFGVVVGLAGVLFVEVVEFGCVAVLAGAVGVGAANAGATKNPLTINAVKICLRMANLPRPIGPMKKKRARGLLVASQS